MFDAAAKERRADRGKKEGEAQMHSRAEEHRIPSLPPEHYGCAVVHSSILSRALMLLFESEMLPYYDVGLDKPCSEV